MPPPRGEARWVAEVYDLIESILQENLRQCPFRDRLEAILQVVQAEKEEDASFVLLPTWICKAVGGDRRRAVPVAAAWCLLHTAALLLDDVEDQELDYMAWPSMSPAQAVNAATGLIFASQMAWAHLGRLGVDGALSLSLQEIFGHTILQACVGQDLDLAADAFSLGDYWQVAEAKSGALFALACRGGAMLGTTDRQQVESSAEFGHNLGVLIQISDDFNGVWNAPGAGDLVAGSKSLPVVYALSVGGQETREHLLDLLSRTSVEGRAVSEARELLADLGALHYLMVQGQVYRRRAQAALLQLEQDTQTCAQLDALLHRVMPVPGSASRAGPRDGIA